MAAQELAVQVGVAPACQALGVSRATFYRRQSPVSEHRQPRPTPARALDESERERVLDVLASPRFVDRSPAEVVATLLDEEEYLCSERTMYRILAASLPVQEVEALVSPNHYANALIAGWEGEAAFGAAQIRSPVSAAIAVGPVA